LTPLTAESLFAGAGETLALMRELDWSQTKLGPVADWPVDLVAAVRTVLPSQVPMLLWWGPDLVQLYNDAYSACLGDKHPAAVGQPAAECWREAWDELGPMAASVLGGCGSTYAENMFLLMDRAGYVEETYWTFSYSPVTDQTGEVRGIFVATSDVTAQFVGEKRLATLRALGSVSTSQSGTVIDSCAAAMRVLARNRGSLPFAAVFIPDEDDLQLRLAGSYGLAADTAVAGTRVVKIDDRSAIGRVALSGDSEMIADLAEWLPSGGVELGPLGPKLPHQALVVPLWVSGQSKPAGVLALGLNPYRAVDEVYRTFLYLVARQLSVLVADARAYESERKRAEGLAELDQDKTHFYQNVSHEFRTPLTLIQGPLHDLLADEGLQLPDGHRDGIEAAHRATLQLRRLVDTLLEFARAEAGQLEAVREPTDIAQLTAELVGMFSSAVESLGLDLDVDIPPLPEPVDVDREMWAKIVMNLLSNAVKFTHQGSITVRMRALDEHVELVVADSGQGIPAAQLPLIFDRFHRVPSQLRRGGDGAGIGLSLVADLLAANGGTVSADSTLGLGSTFTVVLPRTPGRSADHPVRPLEAPGDEVTAITADSLSLGRPEGPPAVPTAPDRGGHVLLVEDNEDMRRYLARLLVEDGWAVTAAGDVDEALATAQAPDLVISDVMLPGRSGLDLVRLLRANPELSRIPVILLTARAGPGPVVEGLDAGADDYVTKPFQSEELLARVRTHFELSQLREFALKQAENQVAHLHVALGSNRQIGAAIGILMAEHKITDEQAFDMLRTASQHTHRKLRDIADDVLLTGAIPD